MTRLLIALLCILAGIALIVANLPRRRYITLSGNVNGRTWARRIPA